MKNIWFVLIGTLLGAVAGYGLTTNAEAKTLDEFFECYHKPKFADDELCEKILD